MSNNSKPRASTCEKAEAAAHCCVLRASDPPPHFHHAACVAHSAGACERENTSVPQCLYRYESAEMQKLTVHSTCLNYPAGPTMAWFAFNKVRAAMKGCAQRWGLVPQGTSFVTCLLAQHSITESPLYAGFWQISMQLITRNFWLKSWHYSDDGKSGSCFWYCVGAVQQPLFTSPPFLVFVFQFLSPTIFLPHSRKQSWSAAWGSGAVDLRDSWSASCWTYVYIYFWKRSWQ